MSKTNEVVKVSAEVNIDILENQKLSSNIKQEIQSITERVESLSRKIEDSKEFAKKANDMKSGLFGKTRKKTDQLATALMKNAEAAAEMHSLIQEVIRFSSISSYAQAMMIQGLTSVIESGFQDSHGDVRVLNDTAKEITDNLIRSIEKAHEAQKRDEEHDRLIADLYKSRQIQTLSSLVSLLLSITAIVLVLLK